MMAGDKFFIPTPPVTANTEVQPAEKYVVNGEIVDFGEAVCKENYWKKLKREKRFKRYDSDTKYAKKNYLRKNGKTGEDKTKVVDDFSFIMKEEVNGKNCLVMSPTDKEDEESEDDGDLALAEQDDTMDYHSQV